MIRSLLLAFAVTLASVAPATAQTLTTARGSPQRRIRGDFAMRFDPSLIQPVIDAALKYGAIATPFRASEIICGAS